MVMKREIVPKYKSDMLLMLRNASEYSSLTRSGILRTEQVWNLTLPMRWILLPLSDKVSCLLEDPKDTLTLVDRTSFFFRFFFSASFFFLGDREHTLILVDGFSQRVECTPR